MEFQHDKSWDSLTTILASKLPARDSWSKFINVHEETVPKSYWTDLKQIDLETEQNDLVNWLNKLVADEPIPKNIVAFWIGILKFADENETEIPTIYFVGADDYDKDDIDWDCDPSYLPENRYVQPGVLQQIDNIARTDKENHEFLDWILPIAYCAFVFDEIVRTKIDTNLFLKQKNKLFISVGHDSGDYVDLTPIKN